MYLTKFAYSIIISKLWETDVFRKKENITLLFHFFITFLFFKYEILYLRIGNDILFLQTNTNSISKEISFNFISDTKRIQAQLINFYPFWNCQKAIGFLKSA